MLEIFYTRLSAWAEATEHKPIVLCGARQVGKTHVLKVLGRDKFESFSYVNLFDGGAKAALTGVDSVHMLLDSMEAFLMGFAFGLARRCCASTRYRKSLIY
ncbi:hypothetical protein O0R44_10940 [Bifidobacterium longum subsp. infantis]|uniref:hypothetical protein n=1 Tax=Bifidobacterium longum TaxID=216816 RepID=UPI0022AAB295|nr:hypothetical protein [Bifidobacterium longum]WAT12303.1 hypothetical protein O0R44_10940 [Bifidobacterium longum subsp. infantis]